MRSVGDEDPWAPIRVPPPEAFLAQYRKQAFELVKNAYAADRSLRVTPAGSLSVNLCEDLVYLLRVQIGALDEYLAALSSSPRGGADVDDVRAEAVSSLLHALYVRQIASRDAFLIDMEGCCAAANDFCRLAESLEEWAEDLCGHKPRSLCLMEERELPALTRLLVSDADYAIRLSCRFVLDDLVLQESDSFGLFGQDWEQEEAGGAGSGSGAASAALSSLLGIVEEYIQDVEDYIGEENLYRKAIEAMIQRTAVVYTESLLYRMQKVRLRREGCSKKEDGISAFPFADPAHAAHRLREDIYALKAFFRSWVLEMPAVDRYIERDFTVISAMQECLSLAGDVTKIGSEGSCIFVAALFEATTRNIEVLRKLVLDIWGLAVSQGNCVVIVLPSCVEEEISRIRGTHYATEQDERPQPSLRFRVSGFNVCDLLMHFYATGRSDGLGEEHSCAIVASREQKLSRRRQAAKALKADFLAARTKLSKVPLSKKKMKRKAKAFLKTCKQAAKLNHTAI